MTVGRVKLKPALVLKLESKVSVLPERVTPVVAAMAASMSARKAWVKSAASAPPSPPGRVMAMVTLTVTPGSIGLERWTV